MRINAFVTFDNIFQELNDILEHPSVANNKEDHSRFLLQNLQNISFPGKLYKSSIESGGLPTLVQHMFNTDEKNEVNFGLRIMNELLPNLSLINAFNSNLPSGSRFYFIKKQNLNSIVEYHQNIYDVLTASTARSDQMRRKVLFCSPTDTVTHQQISDAVYEVANYVDAYFSTLNASSVAEFKQSDYISGGSETNTGLLYRVHVIP
mgnify:CR=1 FL=1